jgi:anionic cell wall polymer biosynthesis LytR-Cps2A-Psr (LCP) family protein
MRHLLLAFLAIILCACARAAPLPTPIPSSADIPTARALPSATATAAASPTPSLTPTPAPDVYVGAILGLDFEKGRPARDIYGTRSDVMEIYRLEVPPSGPMKLTLVAIPRDLYVDVPCTTRIGGIDRANTAWAYGKLDCFVLMMSRDFGLSTFTGPNMAVDMDQFVAISTSLGGLDITPSQTYSDRCGSYNGHPPTGQDHTWVAGQTYHMDAYELLCYARARANSPNADLSRNPRQQEILLAMLTQWTGRFVAQGLSAPRTVGTILATASRTQTDLGLIQATKLFSLLPRMPGMQIRQVTFPIDQGHWYLTDDGLKVFVPDIDLKTWMACALEDNCP